MEQQHSTAVAVRSAGPRALRERAYAPFLRGVKSVGVVSVAAALIGALSLPAAAFGPQGEQFSADELASIVAENSQTVTVATDARVDLVARAGIAGTTAEQLAELQEAAAAIEEARQAELAEARAQAAQVRSTGGSASAAPLSIPANGSIAAMAQSQLGVPYVWGGTSPETGFDCSGFTVWLYGQAGHYLPHSSNAQAGYGTPVPASQVAPGDLLVWNGHVAVFVGGGQIVHAATSGTPVKYSNYAAMLAAFGTPEVRRFG